MIGNDATLLNGRYQLNEELGRGGMGVVHLATDRLTGETVALKQVIVPVVNLMFASIPNLETKNGLRLALAHEFQTLASLRHPHIISVLDYGFDTKKRPYFTMSYLDNAQTIVEAGSRVETGQKVQFVLELLQALAYLHRRGILHRDIKPENVLVSNNTVRVLDFGLSAPKEEALDSVGTWLYIAPEVLLEKPASEMSDLYSVGVLAYRLFAGIHPFDIYSPDILDEILEEPPNLEPLKGVGEGLTAVIAKLLAKRPEERYQSADEGIAAFNAAIGKSVPRETRAIRESYLQAATFVGREEETRVLWAALKQANAGRGSAWLVSGESGVGKSRLLDELRTRALVDGALVLRGQAIEERGQTYQLWRDSVRRLALTADLDNLAASVLKTIVPDMDVLLDRPILPAPVLSGQAGRQRLISTVTQLFQQNKQWIVLILEDLQWSNESLDILRQLNRFVSDLPLLVIGSYRDDEADLRAALPQMSHLHLERLSAQNMAQLSTAMLGEVGQQDEVLALLQRETEGNAFFLVEVVRALAIEAGRLSAIGQMALPEKLFPEGIQTIVARRLSRLSEAARLLLPGVAVLGRQLDLALVQEMIDKLGFAIDLEAWLSRCSDAAVLGVENGRWQFAHDKIREGIVSKFSAGEQITWHTHAAETIETVYPAASEQARILAYHWHKVGNQAKERRYSQVAGEYAQQQFLNEEAVQHLSRALALTPAEAWEQCYDLIQRREQIYHLQGDRAAQIDDIQALQSLAELLVGQPLDRRAEVSLRRANYAESIADYPVAVAAAEEALNQAQTAEQQAASELALGRAFMRQGKYEEAHENFQRSLQITQENDLPQLEADNLRFLGAAASELGQQEQAFAFSDKALQLYRQVENRLGEALILNNLAIAAFATGDLAKSLAFWEQAQVIYDKTGEREGRGRILANLSSLYIHLGDYETANEHSAAALQICREINVRFGICFSLINLGLVTHYTGQAAMAEAHMLAAQKEADQIGSSLLQGYALQDSAYIFAHHNRLPEATAFYEQALQIWRDLEQGSRILETEVGLAQVALLDGELAQAQGQIEAAAAHILADSTLDGAGRLFHIYWVAYEILTAVSDPRAAEILQKAYHLLQEQAGRISDIARRQSFLENVAVHNHIVEAFAQHK
ncbi:MAG: protein kinase [Chloroflexota bacterium]